MYSFVLKSISGQILYKSIRKFDQVSQAQVFGARVLRLAKRVKPSEHRASTIDVV